MPGMAVTGGLHSARTRSFSSTKALNVSLLSCLTSDAVTAAARKAAQIVEYFMAKCATVFMEGLEEAAVEILCACRERAEEFGAGLLMEVE